MNYKAVPDDGGWESGPAKSTSDLQRAAGQIQRLLATLRTVGKLLADMGTAKDSVNLRAQIRANLETTSALYKDSMAIVKGKKLQELAKEDQTLYARIAKQLESAVKEHEQLKIAFVQKEKSLPKPGL